MIDQARLGAEFLWGLVSRDWAGVLLDRLRLVKVFLPLVARGGRGGVASLIDVFFLVNYGGVKLSGFRLCPHL